MIAHGRTKVSAVGCPRLGPKTVFLSHLYRKTNILARQARDTHRENSKTVRSFSRLGKLARAALAPPGASVAQADDREDEAQHLGE
jgi:hypothetical protein